MTGKKIIFYILAAFIIGNFLLIFIQYNSAKNINSLINGNEKVLTEFKVSSNLRELKNDITSVESEIGGTLYTKDSSQIEGLGAKILEVQSDMANLQKISDDDTSVKYIDILDLLVHEKLLLSKQILDSFHLAGKNVAENLITSKRAKNLNDSIDKITNIIESSRQKLLAAVTSSIDKSGKRALNFGFFLIAFVLLSAAALFWFIINTIHKQNQLIQQLNVSEKKVRVAAQAKENFLANMSHEIRTPMNAMLGFTNLLQRKELDKESKEFVQTIQNSGEKLLTIINDILDSSKIEADMMRIEATDFSIRSLVHSIETMFKAKAAEKQLQLSTFVEDNLPDNLEGDATRLTQILVNLIGNSIKFTSNGSIVIKITNEGNINNTISTKISVSDTGIGIEKKYLKSIFDRFQQAEDSVTRKYGGTGLGLSIVQELVTIQNGKIDVESEPGKGTTFHLVIPYKIAATQVGILSDEENKIRLPINFNKISILIVEDNKFNQDLIKHLFNNWQIKFELANNGKEAIEMLTIKTYDLIIMDIQMPELDGYSTTKEIRNTLHLNTPIIAMTAHALAGEREKCLSYGMNEYISKPIREERLQQLIVQFTQIQKPVTFKDKKLNNLKAIKYQYINLQYMLEVSNGNTAYEKNVTEQFIEAIPNEIALLENSLEEKDILMVKQTAHNLKTTISIMGLNEILQLHLDALEYEKLDTVVQNEKIKFIKKVCNQAVVEAKIFLATL